MTRERVPGPSQANDGDHSRSRFESRFRTAARRVLLRHGVLESRIEAEIDRLRRFEPGFVPPSVEELESLDKPLARS
jgi:hypothetical protein